MDYRKDSNQHTDDQKTVVSRKKNLKRSRPNLTKYERLYLSLIDILSVAMIVLDLSYLGGVTKLDPVLLVVANLFMVGFSFVGYLIKKRVRIRG